ncbi:MAG TPA: tRNA isopentenyl-2-thiomethyl-A-37 hydroxylase MiaE [Nannocystaceae bacterium]|nr:tRNA isopentenyl-2-thiomethyl-A-37 hydroxylase MiaE [Nannocystaceae bacterium]
MLHLGSRTDPSWGDRALAHLDDVLLDHAHCEKRAASTAIGLVFRYPQHPLLALPLARLAREELEHFERVVGHVRRRGRDFGRSTASPYAAALVGGIATSEPVRAVETLLACALIEARSCDRMQSLAHAFDRARRAGAEIDEDLRELYHDLLACEARHHHEYVELARELGVLARADVDSRLERLAAHEARVIADAPTLARLHAEMPA